MMIYDCISMNIYEYELVTSLCIQKVGASVGFIAMGIAMGFQ